MQRRRQPLERRALERRNAPSDLNVLIGLWLVVSPFVLGFAQSARHAAGNDILVGLLVAALAAWRVLAKGGGWTAWTNVVLGFWLMASPTMFNHAAYGVPPANDVLSGLAVTVLAILGAFALQQQRTYHDYLPAPGSRHGEFAATELSEEELNERRID